MFEKAVDQLSAFVPAARGWLSTAMAETMAFALL